MTQVRFLDRSRSKVLSGSCNLICYLFTSICYSRPCISVVEISALQSMFIMVLLHLCTPILLLLLGDMQVGKYFEFLKICYEQLKVVLFVLLTKSFFHNFILDVIVHRLLAASLGISKLPAVFQDRPQLTSIADSKLYLDLCPLDHEILWWKLNV